MRCAGLHRRALYALLGFARLKRIVYVSCNLETLASNVVDLVMPPRAVKRRHVATGRSADARVVPEPPKSYVPFVPTQSQAVDMFPQTSHVESVMCLER
jgi:tRNA/tmRNA/rRNA uracil-C5-methylase (TrmA/RlmC/RlmD family)